jgi:hypothetical protein
MSNIVAIAAVGAREAAENAGPALEDRLRAAMRATHHHWLATKEDDQIMAACEGAAQAVGEGPDRERLIAELKVWQALSAAISGVPVDFGAMVPDDEADRPEPVGIRKLWLEVTET